MNDGGWTARSRTSPAMSRHLERTVRSLSEAAPVFAALGDETRLAVIAAVHRGPPIARLSEVRPSAVRR